MLVFLILYSSGAVITNMVIHHQVKGEVDRAAVSIASTLWPVVWALYLVLTIEKGLKWIGKKIMSFFTTIF